MQHSSFRGTLGRQELVGKMVVWGREAGGSGSVVCVGPVASLPTIYASAVTLKAWAVVAGTRSGVWECMADGPACNKDLRCALGAGRSFDGLAYARLGS